MLQNGPVDGPSARSGRLLHHWQLSRAPPGLTAAEPSRAAAEPCCWRASAPPSLTAAAKGSPPPTHHPGKGSAAGRAVCHRSVTRLRRFCSAGRWWSGSPHTGLPHIRLPPTGPSEIRLAVDRPRSGQPGRRSLSRPSPSARRPLSYQPWSPACCPWPGPPPPAHRSGPAGPQPRLRRSRITMLQGLSTCPFHRPVPAPRTAHGRKPHSRAWANERRETVPARVQVPAPRTASRAEAIDGGRMIGQRQGLPFDTGWLASHRPPRDRLVREPLRATPRSMPSSLSCTAWPPTPASSRGPRGTTRFGRRAQDLHLD